MIKRYSFLSGLVKLIVIWTGILRRVIYWWFTWIKKVGRLMKLNFFIFNYLIRVLLWFVESINWRAWLLVHLLWLLIVFDIFKLNFLLAFHNRIWVYFPKDLFLFNFNMITFHHIWVLTISCALGLIHVFTKSCFACGSGLYYCFWVLNQGQA